MVPESSKVNTVYCMAQLQMVYFEGSVIHWPNFDDPFILLFSTWILSKEAHGSLIYFYLQIVKFFAQFYC